MVPDLSEITQIILNLAGMLEQGDKGPPLPLNPQALGEKAMQCRAYAKALHYKEDEFHKEPFRLLVLELHCLFRIQQQIQFCPRILYLLYTPGMELPKRFANSKIMEEGDKLVPLFSNSQLCE